VLIIEFITDSIIHPNSLNNNVVIKRSSDEFLNKTEFAEFIVTDGIFCINDNDGTTGLLFCAVDTFVTAEFGSTNFLSFVSIIINNEHTVSSNNKMSDVVIVIVVGV
jgi:hypothetical protein